MHLTIYEDLFAYIKLLDHLKLRLDLLHAPLLYRKDLVKVDVNVPRVKPACIYFIVSFTTFL